ncbi:MAG: hypothetical protein ACRC1T_03310 [Clostridium chrysemydis]|uniref:hypothetical protein n=1 Tax=Clostridium chrysemydis TaxID=2665504 RepID=UPI003F2D6B34
MLNVILSIIGLMVGMWLGGSTGLDIFIPIFGVCGFFIPSVYFISEIHKEVRKKK